MRAKPVHNKQQSPTDQFKWFILVHKYQLPFHLNRTHFDKIMCVCVCVSFWVLTRHHHRHHCPMTTHCEAIGTAEYALNIILIDNNLQQLMIISAILKRHFKYLCVSTWVAAMAANDNNNSTTSILWQKHHWQSFGLGRARDTNNNTHININFSVSAHSPIAAVVGVVVIMLST